MLSAIPSQYHLFVGIGGLVFLMLLVTSMSQKYQAYQLEKEVALKRMLRGIQQIENVLNLLEGCAIPRKMQIMLRKEILARYVTMRQIHKKLDNIDQLISTAQREIQAAEAKAELNRQRAGDRGQLNRYVNGLTELITFLNSEGHIAGMSEHERKNYQTDLGVLRADYIDDYHTHEAIKLAEQKLWDESAKHLKEIMQYLQTHGPSNDHIKKIYQTANGHYKQVVIKQVPGSQPEAPPQSEEVTAEQG